MRIALVTCERPFERDEDSEFLLPALTRRGCAVERPGWSDPAVDWAAFDLAMLSSTWDYYERQNEFRRWLRRADSETTLANSLDLVEWNLDKRYLRELEAAGVPTIPTVWIEPGDIDGAAAEIADRGWATVVIKPLIDLGARNLVRVGADRVEQMLGAFDVATMAQPYLPSVATEGELSLVYVSGALTHALRKLPARGDFRVQPMYGATHAAAEPGPGIREIAEAAVAAIPGEPLYARVDLLDTGAGYAVIEVELIEPGLYLDVAPAAAETIADALLAAA